MQVQLKSWKAAGLEQVWESAISCQNGVNWCQAGQWRTHRAPTLHLFTWPDCKLHIYIQCMVGSGSGASMGAEKQVGHVWGVQWWVRPS